jgi:adenosylcobinamide-phosphate synthase
MMLAGLCAVEIALLAVAALALDLALGEPRRFHPLAGFGAVAERIEGWLNRAPAARAAGAAAVLLLVAPIAGAAWWLTAAGASHAWVSAGASVIALYCALGTRSLWEHVAPVGEALARHDLARARALGARIVSRELREASEDEVARAAVESALENGNDAVFGALAWFALAGAPGAIAYRLVNTLDAMWGYRSPRFVRFGWAAARLDDALNLIPARLTAATYALLGNTRAALACWRDQAPAWKSPNAGAVMAAGAGALGVTLGGAAIYHGAREERPRLGRGRAPGAQDVRRALRLVARGTLLWLVALGLLAAWEAQRGA